jgi:hypothetical protein
MLVDKAIGIFINDMIHHTSRVYMLSSALSERDPSSESAFDLVQQALQQTGLANVFNLYWEKLVHIIRQHL